MRNHILPLNQALIKTTAAGVLLCCGSVSLAETRMPDSRIAVTPVESPVTDGYLARARQMMNNGNWQGVVDCLLKLDTDHSALPAEVREECDFMLAKAMYESGNPDCLWRLSRFAATYPASLYSIESRLLGADYLFFAHDYKGALAEYSKIVPSEILPEKRDLYAYRTALCIVKGDRPQDARSLLQSIRDNKEFSTAARYYLAYIDFCEGDLENARKGFEQVARSEGRGERGERVGLQGGMQRGMRSERRRGDYFGNGIEPGWYLTQIDYLEGDFRTAADNGSLLLARNPVPELVPQMQRTVGLAYFKLGDLSLAAGYLDPYVAHAEAAEEAVAPDALYALGACRYAQGNYEEAAKDFGRLTDLDNDIAQGAWLYLGQCAVKSGDNSAAALAFEKAARMNYDPEVSETARYNYIVSRLRGGNVPFSSSIGMYEDFLRDFPDSRYAAEVKQSLATAYFNEKDYARALASINRIQNPSSEVLVAKQKVLYELGRSEMAENDVASAEKHFSEAASLSRFDRKIGAESYLWLGDALYAQKKYTQAATAYGSALSEGLQGANRSLAVYNQAYALYQADKFKEAAAKFQTAIKSGNLPQALVADARLRLADCRYYVGDASAAADIYADAMSSDAENADYAAFRHAVMLGLEGKKSNKLTELKKFRSLFPDSRWMPDALMELGSTAAELGKINDAADALETVARKYPASEKAAPALLLLARTYMDAGQTIKGEATLKEVVSRFTPSEEADLADADLKKLLANEGRIQDYVDFISSVPGASKMDSDELESLTFRAAESAYVDNSSDVKRLREYVAKYPDGKFLAPALLELAQSAADGGDHDGAMKMVDELLSKRGDSAEAIDGMFLKAEVIEKQYPERKHEALSLYKRIERTGGRNVALDAYSGIMRTTESNEERVKYARLLKNAGGISASQAEEASLFEALGMLATGESKKGLAALEALAASNGSEAGARANVELGDYWLRNGNLKKAENVLTEFTNSGTPHQYWLAKGYLLLADVYSAQGKQYLATEYLRTLKENYPGNEADILKGIDSRLNKSKSKKSKGKTSR